MSSGLSVYYANKVNDKLMRGVDFTPATSYWCAAFVYVYANTYLRADDIASATECTGGGYARVQVRAGSSVSWIASTNGHTENDTDISFPAATNGWGTIYACALLDAPSGGHVVVWGDLTQAKAVNAPDIFKIQATFFGVNC